MKILGIHHDLLSLMGPTRLFLSMCDLFMDLGHEVTIVGRTRRETKIPTKRGVITERLVPKHYPLHRIRKYHPLKHVHPKDIIEAELPLVHPYLYMPKGLFKAIPEADLVFTDTEIYFHFPKHIKGNYLFYVHWPPEIVGRGEPLKPPKESLVWCNSNYTRREILKRWGPEYKPEVVYPPLWTDMYKTDLGYDERPFDIVMFSRLSPDKFTVLEALKGYKVAVIGSSYGYKPPKWVKLWRGVPLKTVIEVLQHSKIYIHSKGFQTGKTPSPPEHFGITIVEAMAAGCVPIVPKVGGPLEIVENEDYGFTFKSLPELKLKIELLLSNKEEWSYWSRRAAERAGDFDVKKIEEKVRRLL